MLFYVVLRRCRRPLVVVKAVDRHVYVMLHSEDRPLNLPLSYEVVQKGGFGAPDLYRGEDTPDFGHAFSNYTYFRACDQLSLSSVQRDRRLRRRKKEERKKERRKNNQW